MTPAEFDTLAPYIRALTEGKRVERKFAGEPDESWLPCKLESILAMGVAPGRQFRIIEPPLEYWVNVFASGSCACYGTSKDAESAGESAGQGTHNEYRLMDHSKPMRVAVHMREVGEVTFPQCTSPPNCTVIGGKTLDTGSPGERVAILASKDDLDFLIGALSGGMTNPHHPKIIELRDALCELRRKAFGL